MAATFTRPNLIDDHLDDEFVFLAQFIRLSSQYVSEKDRSVCAAWLKRLLSPTRDGTSKDVRNSYLSELLLGMQSGCLSGPFSEPPSEEGALSPVFEPHVQTGPPAWLDTIVNGPYPESGDADDRTYIASQAHPDGKSMHAYVAVSLADKVHWVDMEGHESRGLYQDSATVLSHGPRNTNSSPTHCKSCSGINHTRECTRLPCTQSRRLKQNIIGSGSHSSQCSRSTTEDGCNPLIKFYDELLALIDNVLHSGRCSDDEYIAQLVKRLEDQSTDPTLLGLSPDELRLELLRRLKTKLIARREQAKRGRPNETASHQDTTQHPSETHEDVPPELDLCIDEELWESAARRELSPTNMMLLESVYPPALVERFVNCLIRERCSLISRMRAEHQNLVSSLRNDLEKAVKTSLDRYREARALWVLLLRATQELQHIRRCEMSDADKEESVREAARELQDAMAALDEEGGRGASLADQLVAEHQSLHATERESARHTQRLLAENDALRLRLQVLQAQEASQRRRIEELNHQLKLSSEQ